MDDGVGTTIVAMVTHESGVALSRSLCGQLPVVGLDGVDVLGRVRHCDDAVWLLVDASGNLALSGDDGREAPVVLLSD